MIRVWIALLVAYAGVVTLLLLAALVGMLTDPSRGFHCPLCGLAFWVEGGASDRYAGPHATARCPECSLRVEAMR